MTIGARKEISHSQPLPLHWQHHRHQPSQPARPNNGNNTLKWESWFALSDKRTRRARGTPPRVCLSSNRVPFSLHLAASHSFSLFTAFVSPFASLPFTLCACGLRTCARFHSLLFSLFPSLFAFLHPLLYVVRASFFSPPRRDGIPVSFSIGRLKERIVNRRMSRGFRNGDCSIQRFSPGVARARARARVNREWTACSLERKHQQLVVGVISRSPRAHFNKLIGSSLP